MFKKTVTSQLSVCPHLIWSDPYRHDLVTWGRGKAGAYSQRTAQLMEGSANIFQWCFTTAAQQQAPALYQETVIA